MHDIATTGGALLIGLSLLANGARAADGDDEIATDRPDFVESSNVVGPGRFQIEMGFASERSSDAASRERLTTTPTLLRFGISEQWELRLETDGHAVLRSTDPASGMRSKGSGMADLSVGAKWHLQDEEGSRPSLALLAHVDLASGATAFRGNGARPSLRLVAEWELANDFSLGIMPGMSLERHDDGRRYANGILGIVVGKSLNDKLRTFVELAAPQLARARNGGSSVAVDVGAAYLLSPALQLDIVYSRGMNRNSPDASWMVGISNKF